MVWNQFRLEVFILLDGPEAVADERVQPAAAAADDLPPEGTVSRPILVKGDRERNKRETTKKTKADTSKEINDCRVPAGHKLLPAVPITQWPRNKPVSLRHVPVASNGRKPISIILEKRSIIQITIYCIQSALKSKVSVATFQRIRVLGIFLCHVPKLFIHQVSKDSRPRIGNK